MDVEDNLIRLQQELFGLGYVGLRCRIVDRDRGDAREVVGRLWKPLGDWVMDMSEGTE